mgnify:CR=1 FL=1|tara:strand:- start:47 stop:286 length:240 start_codon:yes stop_codon:yes gene_type:complete
MIKIPKLFYDDHLARDLPSPKILKQTKTNYFISETDEHIFELLDDADYYVVMVCASDYKDLILSAKATIKAIHKYKLTR